MTAILAHNSLAIQVSGTLAAGADKARFIMPVKGTILAVYGSVLTAPTGASILVDINKGGTTIFTTQSNRLAVTATAKDGSAAAVEVATFEQGEIFTLDVDQVGSTIAGADLIVTIAYAGAAL